MVYIIDDKKSRQTDYGWDAARIESYNNILIPIYDKDDLERAMLEGMFLPNNVVLFHESFCDTTDADKHDVIDRFKEQVLDNSGFLYIAYFSGSKCSRLVEGNICMLPPDILYGNLEVFLRKVSNKEFDFQYLAFGEKYNIELGLRDKLQTVVDNGNKGQELSTNKDTLFAITSDEFSIEPPFLNVDIESNWDLCENAFTDDELDRIVSECFNAQGHDVIYIPLCFGETLSDYQGLRLALHIRLTAGTNQFKPIFIYGESSYEELCHEEFFDVLKMTGIHLIHCDYDSLVASTQLELHSSSSDDLQEDLKHITINIPSNIYDNHSVANKWSIYRWKEMLNFGGQSPEIKETAFLHTIYFKFLVAKYGAHQKFNKSNKYPCKIEGISGKKIVYIDDEYDKGWESILSVIFEQSNASLLTYKDFNKNYSQQELIDSIKKFVDSNLDADCYLLDLRLYEADFYSPAELTGHTIAKYIKECNEGNQIVVFTASNKIWNFKEEIFTIGATGYVLKESPIQALKREESKNEYISFANNIKRACSMSYLKDMLIKQKQIEKQNDIAAQLRDVVKLLSIDNGRNNQMLLGAALLAEIVYIEETIKAQGYEIMQTSMPGKSTIRGKEYKSKYELCIPNYKDNIDLTGHWFVKTEKQGKHKTIIDINYSKSQKEAQEGWEDIAKTDVVLVATVLHQKGVSLQYIRNYVTCKYIRNTQIAHGGNRNTKLSCQMVRDLFENIICCNKLNSTNE